MSAFIPAAITPLLMLGGLYLSYEGAEKVLHSLFHSHAAAQAPEEGASIAAAPPVASDGPGRHTAGLGSFNEKEKVQGAIRTDFILSAEIIAIALGTVAHAPLMTQTVVVALIALLMTVGVYGFVAAVVRMDDMGIALARRSGVIAPAIGRAVLSGTPYLMRGLSIAGTAAMFLVGGGILVHGIPQLAQLTMAWSMEDESHVGLLGALIGGVTPILFNAAVGAVAGLFLIGLVKAFNRLRA